jgi:iron-sulfur cluster assembly accessory protein
MHLLPEQEPIVISDTAAARLAELQRKNSNQIFLRLSVDTGGCSGLEYRFELDTNGPQEDDYIFSHVDSKTGLTDAMLLCDDLSFQHVHGCKIDYKISIERAAFEVIANPNAAGKCGCGTSFQPKTL